MYYKVRHKHAYIHMHKTTKGISEYFDLHAYLECNLQNFYANKNSSLAKAKTFALFRRKTVFVVDNFLILDAIHSNIIWLMMNR